MESGAETFVTDRSVQERDSDKFSRFKGKKKGFIEIKIASAKIYFYTENYYLSWNIKYMNG